MRVLLFLLTRWQVKGKENVPARGPLLVVVNHLGAADPPLIGVSVNRKAVFLAKEELFNSRFLSYFVRNFGAVPLRRRSLNKEALRKARGLLAQGMALIMFPEGRRSPGVRLESASSGSALLALRSGAPVLPVGITGTEKIKGVTWIFRRPRITVNIGCPFCLPPLNGRVTRTELAELTHSIMGHIAELLPAEYRGEYHDTKGGKHES